MPCNGENARASIIDTFQNEHFKICNIIKIHLDDLWAEIRFSNSEI